MILTYKVMNTNHCSVVFAEQRFVTSVKLKTNSTSLSLISMELKI
jgi:hypothetical protein